MKCVEFARDGILFWAAWAVATISILFAPDSDAFPGSGISLAEISSARPAPLRSAHVRAQFQKLSLPGPVSTVCR